MVTATRAILVALAIAVSPVAASAQGGPAGSSADDVSDRYMAARAHWQAKRYDEAIPVLVDIVTHHRRHRVGPFAANILLDSYVATKRYDALEQLARDLLRDKKFLLRDPGLEQRLQRLVAQIERKGAEDLERAGDYAGCAAAYLAIFNRGTSPGLDEVAYNAAWCLMRDHRVGAALTVWAQLRQRFPRSVHSGKALMLSANVSEQITHYRRAARLYREYARKYAGEKDAGHALSNAAVLFRATGDLDGAVRALEHFIKMYQRKRRIDSAGAMLALADIELERRRPDRAIKVYKRYLKTFGRRGGAHRLIRAHARLAELLWRSSCRGPSSDALCTATKARKGRLTVAVRRRDPRLSGEAERLLARALSLSSRVRPGDDDPVDRARAKAALSEARLALAARSVEQALAAGPSTAAALDKARKQHVALLESLLAHDAVGAAARIARIDELAGAPNRAADAYRLCAALASKTNIFSPTTRRCHAALERLAPKEFPRQREIHGTSNRAGTVIGPAPIERSPASLATPRDRGAIGR